MPLSKDVFDIVELILIQNLANLSQPTPTLIIPAGLLPLFTAAVVNHFSNLRVSSDIQQTVITALSNPDLIVITIP